MNKLTSLVLAFLCFLSSCGYKFAGSESKLGQRFKNVAVKVGLNRTANSELENRILDHTKSLLARYRDVNLVEDETKADAIIRLNLLDYETVFGAVGKTGTFDIDEYNILTYKIDLTDYTGNIVWSSNEQKISSFSALSLAAFDEGGSDTIARGFSSRDLRSGRDIASIESDYLNTLFAEAIANVVEDGLLEVTD
ncbi:MAG: hypothetical protein NZO16_03385 [Deltaproteobacteria bacterium]|nr:hypothetical protein [Deltaproteobacteria bacterium]